MNVSSPSPVCVLHVDDDPRFGELTATFLRRESDRFSVETATSAADGLALLADGQPDCIVSDYDMPGQNGIEFLTAVREEHPELPFILYTSKGSEAVASEAISAGVTDYLQKGTGTERYKLLANRIINAVEARRDAQTATRQEQLMRLTERVGDTGGWELDRSTDRLLLTEGTRRLFSLSDDRPISVDEAIDRYHPNDRSAVRDALEETATTGERTHGTWRLHLPEREERLVDMTITPVTERDEVTRLRGAIHDVTDHKQRERTLERQVDRLEEFTGIVSHDLQNPLAVAQGRLELAQADCESPQLDIIDDALDRMEAIIDDALTLARRGRTVVDKEPVSVAEIVEAAWNAIETGDSTCEVDDCTVYGDRTRLRQLFENLLRNAVEHSPDPVTVRVGQIDVMFTSTRAGTDDPAGFYVEDDGPGIPPARRESVFDPGKSTRNGGTGFGLAIVKRIAEAHDWEVSLSESVGGGAQFKFTNVR